MIKPSRYANICKTCVVTTSNRSTACKANSIRSINRSPKSRTAWHQQLRQLQAKVVALQVQDQRQLLQIDDLDHLIDDLNSQQQSLQQELESVCRQYSLEHQELRQLVAVTDQELSDCRIRLGAESEEKVSLMRSLALTTVSERQTQAIQRAIEAATRFG